MGDLSVDAASRAAVSSLNAAGSGSANKTASDGGAGASVGQGAVSSPDNSVISPKGVVDAESGLYILQFRDGKTGDVIQQYPSQKVVAAYKRGGETAQAPAQPVATGSVATGEQTGSGGSVAVSGAPVASAPTPAAPAAPASSTAGAAAVGSKISSSGA